MTERYNLLDERLFTVRTTGDDVRSLSLPAVLDALHHDTVASFLALQNHQTHAWHSFLVQLAALAIHRSGLGHAPDEAPGWEESILNLTDGMHEPWTLVVSDLSHPAFMQPPVPEGTLTGFKARRYVDEIDVLNTARNHDVKARRICRSAPELWIHTLVSCQTMQGYAGRGNYGIARMNSGYGSRPAVAYAPDIRPGSRFVRDLGILLQHREELENRPDFCPDGGQALLWLLPWDGEDQIDPPSLDPWFIEICRRIRMTQVDDALIARIAPSHVARIAGEDMKGDTGDAWTPVSRDKGSALTITPEGFTYRRLQELLFTGRFRPGAAGMVQADERGAMVFVTQAMARGQGKTGGYHARVTPVPGRITSLLAREEGRDALGRRSQDWVEMTDRVAMRALRPALCALMQGGQDQLDFRDERIDPRMSAFEMSVDRVFFDDLWQHADATPEAAREAWLGRLRELAIAQLEEAIRSAPVPVARRYRAIASAERWLYGGLKRIAADAGDTASSVKEETS